MIEAVAEGYDLRSLDERDFINEAFNPRPQRELGAAHSLLNQVHHSRTIVETSSVLVTPTPVWSTVVETQSYLTSVTRPVSTEVPIILRGSKVITTIFEESVVEGRPWISFLFKFLYHLEQTALAKLKSVEQTRRQFFRLMKYKTRPSTQLM